VVAAALILAGVGLWLTATRMGYLSDTNDLIRRDAKFQRYLLRYFEEFNITQDFVVVVRGGDFAENKAVVTQLAKRFDESQRFSKIFYRIDFSSLEKRFLLFLPESDLIEMEQGLTRFADMMQTGPQAGLDLNSMLTRANAMFDEKYLRKAENWQEFKPFIAHFASSLNGLADQLERPNAVHVPTAGLDKAMGFKGGIEDLERLKSENEFLAFDGGKTLMLVLTPKEMQKEALSPHADNIGWVRQVIKEQGQQYPNVRIGLTGEPVLDADQIESSMSSVAVATGITLALIVGLFLVAYREFARPMLAIVALLIGVMWSMGFTVLAVGHLNIISNAFVAMILGLGIDFGIQILGRYEEEVFAGRSVADALEHALAYTGMPVLTGAMTTAAAFLSMCFNDFVGLSELGIISGVGIMFCAVANLVVLPALVSLRDRRRSPEELVRGASPSHWTFAHKVDRPFQNHPRWVLVAAVLATAGAGFGLKKVTFDYNLLNLQNPKFESVQVELDLLHSNAHSVIFAAVTAKDIVQAQEWVARLKALPTVQSVASLTEVLPQDQEKKLAILRRIHAKLKGMNLRTDVSKQVDVARGRKELALLLEQSREGESQARKFVGISRQAREAQETFALLIPSLERVLKAFEGRSQKEVGEKLNAFQIAMFGGIHRALGWILAQDVSRPIEEKDIPPELLRQFRGKTGKVLIQVFPRENIWDREPNERFVADVRSVDPEATGTPVQNLEYIDILKRSFEEAALYAAVVIVIAVLLYFRNLKWATLNLVPLGLGILWTVGIMPLFGLTFNPANIITLPLVIGIGVAYGVYAVDRWSAEPGRGLFDSSTGKAILLSALTTIFGFASLIQATYRGISSLGTLMTVGVGMCLVTSLVVLPALLRILAPPPSAKDKNI
jgi:hopanoid biosynthesis associated RND transporter like protein HpnN